jgi:hypothetical protein
MSPLGHERQTRPGSWQPRLLDERNGAGRGNADPADREARRGIHRRAKGHVGGREKDDEARYFRTVPNLDNKDLVAGTTLYMPVHAPGALRRGNDIGARSYGSIASILRHGLDRAYAQEKVPDGAPIKHANIRGQGYYH